LLRVLGQQPHPLLLGALRSGREARPALGPEGVDQIDYDQLDRLTRVRRTLNGATVATEGYGYNALGALAVNASVSMDHQRPRLDGGGLADAAVPNTLEGQPVTLDGNGRITALKGLAFAWDFYGSLIKAGTSFIGVDSYMRRVWKSEGGRTSCT
jgi:hypothetical protein